MKWFGLPLIIASCATNSLVPNRTIPDTRHLFVFMVDSTVSTQITGAYRDAYPNEVALCLYGKVSNDTLTVTRAVLAKNQRATPAAVSYNCKIARGFVGTLHTHPLNTNPYIPCLASTVDLTAFAFDDAKLVHYVLCANHTGFVQVRDGRFWFFRWTE